MNRRQKIIVSVTGIFLVVLILVGLTYAYFLTRIDGNEAEKSISVTTADLAIKYSDDNQVLEVGEALVPGNTVKFKEGETITETKTFTVENTGNDVSEYVVIIEGMLETIPENRTKIEPITVTYANTTDKVTAGDVTTFESNDFRYTLKCTNQSDALSCNSVTDMIFPLSGGVMVGNSIPVGETQNYELTMEYVETNTDQSNDMNKTFSARVDIMDIRSINPYSDNTASLAYNLIENSRTGTGGTKLVNAPLTTPAAQVSSVTNYKTTGEEATYAKSMLNMSGALDATWYYYTTAVVDATTGKFTLSGQRSCQYNSTTINDAGETVNCYDDMINKYLYDYMHIDNISADNHIDETITGLLNVYKVTEATSSTLNYVTVYNSPNEAERVLVPTADDYGVSYYYRGDVEDNYVNFAGMCWRIVRIEGDGSVKLILDDRYTTCNDTEDTDGTGTTDYKYTGNWSDDKTYAFGYDTNTYTKADFLNYTSNDGLQHSFQSFQTTLAKKINTSLTDTSTQEEVNESLASKLKIDEWCYDDKVTETSGLIEYYGAYTRIMTNGTSSLNCTGTKLTKFNDNTDMYVATLTADEIAFAGAAKFYGPNNDYDNFYLINNYSKEGSKKLPFMSLSLYRFDRYDNVFNLSSSGHLLSEHIFGSVSYSRPAVSLKSGIIISEGNGTIEKPFIIG